MNRGDTLGHDLRYQFGAAGPGSCPTGAVSAAAAGAGANTNRTLTTESWTDPTLPAGKHPGHHHHRLVLGRHRPAVHRRQHDQHRQATAGRQRQLRQHPQPGRAKHSATTPTTHHRPEQLPLRPVRPTPGPTTLAIGTDTANNAAPDPTTGQYDNSRLGQHQRGYEHAGTLALTQTGARIYNPDSGRFLPVEPIEGGSSNNDYCGGYSNLTRGKYLELAQAHHMAVDLGEGTESSRWFGVARCRRRNASTDSSTQAVTCKVDHEVHTGPGPPSGGRLDQRRPAQAERCALAAHLVTPQHLQRAPGRPTGRRTSGRERGQ